MPDKERKEKIIGVRFDSSTINEIEALLNKHKLSKSKFTRTAIHNYLTLFEEQDMKKNPKMILSQNLFAYTLECLNDTQLDHFAQLSFDNGVIYGTFLTEKLYFEEKELENKKFRKDWIIFLLKHLDQQVFSETGMNWFTETRFQWLETEGVFFSGKHNLGTNFSIFIKYLLSKYLAKPFYHLTKEKIEPGKLSLIFEPL